MFLMLINFSCLQPLPWNVFGGQETFWCTMEVEFFLPITITGFPPVGSHKGNFDVAVRGSFSVAAGVLSDDSGNIIMAVTHQLPSLDALAGEAFVALLTTRMATSLNCDNFIIEGEMLSWLF
jgi:hypothetical protein